MKIYFKVNNKKGIIPCCDWNENITPESDWYVGEIDHPVYEEHSIPLWKYENGECKRRTAEEIQTDIDAIPPIEPTSEEILRADVDYLLMLQE